MISWLAAGLALASLGPACEPPTGSPDRDVLTLGAYSVVREAFHEGL